MPTSPRRAPLVMAPFRGLRFDAAVVGDLGTVISPPYDVLDADTVRDLEDANRRNIVRLILSRTYERPYLAVRRRLERWRAEGCLVPDPDPGLYLYEYTVENVTVRGLIGLVKLREEAEGVILPHEDVMPGPVEDRTVLMRTTRTNPEPILLVHHGSPRLRQILSDVGSRPAIADFSAGDGSHHKLWAATDEPTLAAIAEELEPGQALIADGHHRYAAYQRLQRTLREATSAPGTSPWDLGLAMLVDQDDYPLAIRPIHRSVSALTMSDVLEVSADRGDEVVTYDDRESALDALSLLPTPHAEPSAAAEPGEGGQAVFAVSDGRTWAVLATPRRHAVDAAVLHSELFPAWDVAEEQVGYHHSLDQALDTTARQPGVVIAVRPPLLTQVMQAAAQGARLPRKSTSFSPKPRMGLVLRDLRDT